jgi:hypothetical protein
MEQARYKVGDIVLLYSPVLKDYSEYYKFTFMVAESFQGSDYETRTDNPLHKWYMVLAPYNLHPEALRKIISITSYDGGIVKASQKDGSLHSTVLVQQNFMGAIKRIKPHKLGYAN